MAPDVIDQRFFDYVLTMPLPPLVGRDWGAEATHPDIPLIADTPPLEEEVVPLQEATPEPRTANRRVQRRPTGGHGNGSARRTDDATWNGHGRTFQS